MPTPEIVQKLLTEGEGFTTEFKERKDELAAASTRLSVHSPIVTAAYFTLCR
ncbi:MAG: hypothetical protein LBS62_13975 [Clostridiales bacterium]|nr:hypothetical protein [Clostridiales bacterium]